VYLCNSYGNDASDTLHVRPSSSCSPSSHAPVFGQSRVHSFASTLIQHRHRPGQRWTVSTEESVPGSGDPLMEFVSHPLNQLVRLDWYWRISIIPTLKEVSSRVFTLCLVNDQVDLWKETSERIIERLDGSPRSCLTGGDHESHSATQFGLLVGEYPVASIPMIVGPEVWEWAYS
jgi:hypothetical protein